MNWFEKLIYNLYFEFRENDIFNYHAAKKQNL